MGIRHAGSYVFKGTYSGNASYRSASDDIQGYPVTVTFRRWRVVQDRLAA
jgi:hypothetical protein